MEKENTDWIKESQANQYLDFEKLLKEIEYDEGRVEEVYLDHLGYKTIGIGHLVDKTEPEWDLPVGSPILPERVDFLFAYDVSCAVKDCHKLYKDFEKLPEEVKRIIANMSFNLGYPRLKKFKNMKKAVDAGNWKKASEEMTSSKWYNQVPMRAGRLVRRMSKVGY